MSQLQIAILAPGEMGAGVGGRLVERGAAVVTSLAGRSEASRARALAAGLGDIDEADVGGVDILLSILPPGEALPLAKRLAPILTAAARKPLYVDGNAVSPETVGEIARVVAATGCRFVDVGIIGGPPRPDGYSPVLHASGPDATALAVLNDLGLDVRVMDGPVGQASALKMCFGAITKGLHAIGIASMLGAVRAGVADDLIGQLAEHQPALLKQFRGATPRSFPKAYRWVAEMEEISAFLGGAGAGIYQGAARQFEQLAADQEGGRADEAAVVGLLRG